MNELKLKLFENPEFGSIRVIEIDGEPWFVAVDVCKCLEIGNARQAITRLDDDEKSTVISNDGHPLNIVSESGVYSLVLGSRKPEAKAFKRWITHEVIPTIRKHGAYMTDEALKKALTSPDFLIQLATELKTEKEKNQQLETQIEADKPKTIFADAVSVSKNSILIGDLAKLIRQNGYEIGQQRLFRWMRENNYLIKNGSSYNMPTQYSMERGWFEVKETVITHADGHTSINKTPKVTGKGPIYFINLFLNKRREREDD